MTVTWTKIGTTKYVSGPNGGSTGTIDTTASGGAKLFAVFVNWFGATEPALTDSVGGSINNYIAESMVSVGFINSRAYYCIPAQNSATMSWNVSGTGNVPSCYVEVWTNNVLGSILVDQYVGANYNNSAQSDIAGSLTNSAADTLGLAFYCAGTAGTITVDSSFTLDQSTAYNPGVSFGGACASFTYASTVAKNPTLSWTSANVIDDKTAAFFIFQGGVNSPLNVVEFEDHCVIPVNNGTSAATPLFTGNYDQSAGTPVTIEIELRTIGGTILQAFTAGTSASFGSGSWSARFSCPAGSGYVCRVRTKNGGGTVLETSSITSVVWGVTNNAGGCIGQSNLVQMNDTISSPPAAHEWARTWDGATYAQPTGNGYIEMMNAIIAGQSTGLGGTDIPSLITLTGLGGVGVTLGDGSPGGYWLETTSPADAFQLFKTKCDALRGVITYILDCGGSTDAIFAVPYSTLYAGTQTLRSNTNAHFSYTNSQLPWMVIVNGKDDNAGDSNSEWQTCKDVDIDFATNEPFAYFAASLTDLVLLNDYHLTGAGYGHAGRRIAQSILKLLGVQARDGASVKISYAKRVFGSANITIIPDLNGGTVLNYADTTTSGVGQVGWEVSKDSFSTTLTVSSTTFSANNIVLTLSGAPANGDDVQVRYLYGKNLGIDLTKIDYNNVFPAGDSLQVALLPSSSQSPTDVQIETLVSLTGVSGTGTQGAFSPVVSIDTSVNLTGVLGTGTQGAFTVTTSADANISLTGVFGTGSIGTFTVQHSGGLVDPPILLYYQLYAGLYETTYAQQLDSCIRQLCLLYDVPEPTANWYNPITGTLLSDWAIEIDAAVRLLCIILFVPPPSIPITNQTYGTLDPTYALELDTSVRALCAVS